MSFFNLSVRGFLCAAIVVSVHSSQLSAQPASKQKTASKKQQKQQKSLTEELSNSTKFLNTDQRFLFQYKLKPGEELYYNAEHTLTEKTTLKQETDKLASRSRSLKKYRVTNVDSVGRMSFDHINVKTKSILRKNDEKPIIFDSESPQRVPDRYLQVAQTIGAVLLSYCIERDGKIVSRKAHFKDWDLRSGKAILQFPPEPIPVGFTWYDPKMVTAKRRDLQVRKIQLRIKYKLASVRNGIARFRFETEVLTPITPKLKSQILQHLVEGYRDFDIPKGRFVTTHIEWNHTVPGWEGSGSNMEYLGSYTETLTTAPKKTRNAVAMVPQKKMEIRTIDAGPIIRR